MRKEEMMTLINESITKYEPIVTFFNMQRIEVRPKIDYANLSKAVTWIKKLDKLFFDAHIIWLETKRWIIYKDLGILDDMREYILLKKHVKIFRKSYNQRPKGIKVIRRKNDTKG